MVFLVVCFSVVSDGLFVFPLTYEVSMATIIGVLHGIYEVWMASIVVILVHV